MEEANEEKEELVKESVGEENGGSSLRGAPTKNKEKERKGVGKELAERNKKQGEREFSGNDLCFE